MAGALPALSTKAAAVSRVADPSTLGFFLNNAERLERDTFQKDPTELPRQRGIIAKTLRAISPEARPPRTRTPERAQFTSIPHPKMADLSSEDRRCLEERRAANYQRRFELESVELKVREHLAAQAEVYREFRHIEATEGPRRERLARLQSRWLVCLAVASPIFILTAQAKKFRALEMLRFLLAPSVARRFLLKRRRRERGAFTAALSQGKRPPNVESLLKHKFFEMWPRASLQNLASVMVPQAFREGEHIMTEGELGDSMYFLDIGSVDIVIKKTESHSKSRSRTNGFIVATLESGAYFGEFALLSDEPRTATIIAKCDCLCWALTKVQFLSQLGSVGESAPLLVTLKSLSDHRRQQNMKKLYPLKPENLRRLPMFAHWPDEQLTLVIERMEPAVLHVGDVLFREGEVADAMYFLARGECEVLKRKASPRQQVSDDQPNCSVAGDLGLSEALLRAGDAFGEIGCLFLELRSATIRCTVNSDLWRLSKVDLSDIMLSHVVLFVQSKARVNRIRAEWIQKVPAKQLVANPLVKEHFGQRVRRAPALLYPVMMPFVFTDGDVVAERGSMCTGIHFINSGCVESPYTHIELGPGQTLGSDATSAVRIYQDTFKAVSKVECWFLPFSALQASAGGLNEACNQGKQPEKQTPKKPGAVIADYQKFLS
eukprot:NODE_221_length_2689_cov_30.958712_g203_i0.p1 GENE.NODE_221_length_2689_cov_30.958712_g203_i0~~NODE_221_length_2689_cov_30.958712_g203_i0.p1  ORF type:complete len:662 (-),score=125.17 NODE_221_length_2689_cov_30.958712_g203_i0:530-2515(-)